MSPLTLLSLRVQGEPAIEDYYDDARAVSRQTSGLISHATRLATKGAQSLLGQGRFLRLTHARLVGVLALVLRNTEFGIEGAAQNQIRILLRTCTHVRRMTTPPSFYR